MEDGDICFQEGVFSDPGTLPLGSFCSLRELYLSSGFVSLMVPSGDKWLNQCVCVARSWVSREVVRAGLGATLALRWRLAMQ